MRGRQADGSWVTPFNPEYPYYEYMYREANAWQQTFFVPHDTEGLIDLFGGAENFMEKLDSMFTIPWNPEYIARNVCCFLGQYSHGNQPDHHVPYLYYFVDRPDKSQEIINDILDLYGAGEASLALPGMDDCGEMSAWYVFASMGIYPFSPSDPEYMLSVPIFKRAEIVLGGDRSLVINRNSETGGYIEEIRLNGNVMQGYTLRHEEIENGAVIDIN